MKFIIIALLIVLSGCSAERYSARTIATYKIMPDGTLEASYNSSKEQQGLDLDIESENGKLKVVRIHADKSSTDAAAIAAALQSNLKLIQLVETLSAAAKAAPK